MGRPRKYPVEVRERAVRLARESERGITPVARDLGLNPETLRGWVRQAEADDGSRRDLLSGREREELVALRRENRELRRSNEILKAASVFFARELDQPRPR
jgi:transposase